MPLPALAALLTRLAPAMLGEGELLSGLVSRAGLTAGAEAKGAQAVASGGAEAKGGLSLKSMFADLLTNTLMGESKPKQKRETEEEKDERIKSRRHVPSAADLFGYRPPPKAVTPQMPVPLARTSVTAPAGSAANSHVMPQGGPTQPGGSTFVPAAATPNAPVQQSVGMLKQFGNLITKSLGPLGSQIKFGTKLATGMYSASKSLELFVWGISESNRGLARWNGEIAASFAQLDIANMQRDIKAAGATSGTTTALNTAFNDLLNELQPMREAVSTGLNTIGIVAARIGQGVAILNKWNPYVLIFRTLMEKIEENTNKEKPAGDVLTDWLKGMGSAGRGGPVAPPVPIGPRAPLPPLI